MSFTQSTFAPVGAQSTAAPSVYTYDTPDSLLQVTSIGYFIAKAGQLDEGDIINAVTGDGFVILGVTSDTSTASLRVSDTTDLITPDDLPKTAFGELAVAAPTPVVQIQFPYNINSDTATAFGGNGGSASSGDGHASINSGTDAAGYALLFSNSVMKYNAGQGALVRFTALFTPGVIDSEQIAGIGNWSDGFFFGYDGDEFGVLKRSNGELEIRTLTVTTGSSTAENITITLDGVADVNVPVTASGDPCQTAREISNHSYFNDGNGWGARSVGNKVEFYSLESAPKLGVYSLSGATTAVGTFAQTIEGVVPTEVWVHQSGWNKDAMDGTGPSGQIGDWTKGNVFQIRYQWLGYGAISFYVENKTTGEFQRVHLLEYANTNTDTSVRNPTLSVWFGATNKGGTTNLTVKTASVAAFVEGVDAQLGPLHSVDHLFVSGATTAEVHVLTIRNKGVFSGVQNRVRVKPLLAVLTSNLKSATANTTFRVYIDATSENGCVYTDIATNSSVTEYDVSAIGFDASNAQKILTLILSSSESKSIDLERYIENINTTETLMITAQASKSDLTNEVGASINWRELF